MAAHFFTFYPACNAAFQVISRQLGTTGGYVRCGACLTAFQVESASSSFK
ncbi:MJ0042-type zinc finger domain-containing protein [Candidatus Sororendozoicomonas aggregata]